MYKNIEILDKKKHNKLKFDVTLASEIGIYQGLIPLGFKEISQASQDYAIIINNEEFLAFTGLNPQVNVLNKDNVYEPMSLKTYPFLNVFAKDEKDELNSVIGIDVNSEFVGEDKDLSIFDENELSSEADEKVKLVRELNLQRNVSKKIVSELKEKDLLEKREFKIKLGDEEKPVLNEFYIVNRIKLNELDDQTIATWAKKGWITLFDLHLKSLENFEKIVNSKN